MRILSAKKRRSFYESQLGSEQEVLFEEHFKHGYMHGYTRNYVKVKAFWNPELVNSKKRIRLKNIDSDGMVRFEESPQLATLA